MSKLVLVLNCGSSSLKFAVIDATTGDDLLSGLAECFNLDDARIKWKLNGEKGSADLGAGAAHQEALDYIVNKILPLNPELSQNLIAIGHRVVHGGERFTSSVVICDDVIAGIEAAVPYAPLHNPAHLIGIREARRIFPALADKNVAVFDTAFHRDLPEHARRYAVPDHWHQQHGLRRYGFHGISHASVARQAAVFLQRPPAELRLISLHLGNGASACAIAGGRSVDTSMGMTPLEGLVMGTRSGDLDIGAALHVARREGWTLEQLEQALTRDSGLRGLCGDSDIRAVLGRCGQGDAGAQLALSIYCYRIRKYLGAYIAALGGLDALVFTGGVGENAAAVRAGACEGLAALGIAIDCQKNALPSADGPRAIEAQESTVAVLVIP
jgi:acetate kinase